MGTINQNDWYKAAENVDRCHMADKTLDQAVSESFGNNEQHMREFIREFPLHRLAAHFERAAQNQFSGVMKGMVAYFQLLQNQAAEAQRKGKSSIPVSEGDIDRVLADAKVLRARKAVVCAMFIEERVENDIIPYLPTMEARNRARGKLYVHQYL